VPEIMKLVIAWTCVGVFIATAVITLLALVRVIALAEKKYLDRLFKLLVVEIVVVSVAFFGNWLRTPAAVEEGIQARTADAVSTETARGMNESYAPMVAEYRQYVARDAALSPEQRAQKQDALTAVQKLETRELLRVRQLRVR
jgi:uncharacterized membrane protein YcgQ (UPF0703/DUF1980 family)